jgi:hypothetical protein
MEVSGQLQTPAALPLGKEPLVSTGYAAGWTPEPARTILEKRKCLNYGDSNPELSVAVPVARIYTN